MMESSPLFIGPVEHGFLEFCLANPKDDNVIVARAVFSPERALAIAYAIEEMVKVELAKNPNS